MVAVYVAMEKVIEDLQGWYLGTRKRIFPGQWKRATKKLSYPLACCGTCAASTRSNATPDEMLFAPEAVPTCYLH